MSVIPKNSVLLCVYLWAKELNAKDIRKKYFLFTVGSVCSVKQFTTGSRNSVSVMLWGGLPCRCNLNIRSETTTLRIARKVYFLE
jgi:hypothetical protein